MTAEELIKELEKFPSDTPVVVSSDAEGNRISPLSGIGGGIYIAQTTWYGELYGVEDPEAPIKGEIVVSLWPLG